MSALHEPIQRTLDMIVAAMKWPIRALTGPKETRVAAAVPLGTWFDSSAISHIAGDLRGFPPWRMGGLPD